jgi:hypothetical protein
VLSIDTRTLEGDDADSGSYDPNGAFESLGGGQTATDSFTTRWRTVGRRPTRR